MINHNQYQLSKIIMISTNSIDTECYDKQLQINYNHIQVKRFTILSFAQKKKKSVIFTIIITNIYNHYWKLIYCFTF